MEEICTASITFRSACLDLVSGAESGHLNTEAGGAHDESENSDDGQEGFNRKSAKTNISLDIRQHPPGLALRPARSSRRRRQQTQQTVRAAVAATGRVPSGRLVAKRLTFSNDRLGQRRVRRARTSTRGSGR